MSCRNGEPNCGISLNGWRLICPICDKCKSNLEQSITNLTRWNELKNEEIRQLQAEKQKLKRGLLEARSKICSGENMTLQAEERTEKGD